LIWSLCIRTVCALTSFTAYLSLVATALCLAASFTLTSLKQSSNSFLHCFYVAIAISSFSVHPYVVRGVRAIVFWLACCHISNTQHVLLQCLYSASVLGISICTFSNDWYKQIIVCTKRHFLQCSQMWFVAWHACICTFSNATLEPSVFSLDNCWAIVQQLTQRDDTNYKAICMHWGAEQGAPNSTSKEEEQTAVAIPISNILLYQESHTT